MQYQNPEIESSYRQNDLGRTLYDFVLAHRPENIVEWGTLYGYSTVAMAMALDELGTGHIIGYDLFEDYEFKHSSMTTTQKNIDRYGVGKYVTLVHADFEEWIKHPEPFDLLHLDLSNKGDTLQRVHMAVKEQIAGGSVVLFEGGSKERDDVEWMVKYNKMKLADSGVPYEILNPAFPSISRMRA